VLARLMSGVLMGAVLGQLLSGLLADTLGWRWAFGVVAGLFAAVAWWMHRSPVARQPARRGVAGPARGLRGWWRGYLGLARPPWARLVLAVALTEGLLWYGAVAFVPTALHQRFGVPLWQAAGVAALVGVGGLAYTLLASPLVHRLGEARLALLGGLLVTLGLLAIGLAPWLPVVAAGALLLGMGFYAFHNTLQVHGTQLSTDSRGMAMALFALCLFLGQSIGVALAAQLTAWVGFGGAFGVAALAFLLLTLGFVVALGRRGGAVPG
jgi:MFS transporter, YNFM family, putative membrane transport protein